MGTEWKRLNLQSGAFVAVVTAIAIGAGAMLWYMRQDPRYPTTADEATIRFALLERAAVDSDGLNTETNSVGFYPSSYFYLGTGAGTLEGYLSLLGGYLDDSPWCDLWAGPIPGLAHINGRNIGDYPYVIDPSERIDIAWWRTNIYADAMDFGSFSFTANAGPPYMNTNILHQSARAISAFRWRLAEGPYLANTNPVGYYDLFSLVGSSAPTNNYYDAVLQARAALGSRDFTSEEYDKLENNIVLRHWLGIRRRDPIDPSPPNPPWPDDHFVISLLEECELRPRRCYVPPATNCTAWEIAAFAAVGERFWHPYAVTGQWEMTSIAMKDIGGGTNCFVEELCVWQGRIDPSEIGYPAGYIPDWYYRPIVGWKSVIGDWDTPAHDQVYGDRPVFLIDWKFQCLTDHPQFW
jgi:hypothetical protein